MKLFNAHGQFSGAAITSFLIVALLFCGALWLYSLKGIAPEQEARCESIGAVRHVLLRSDAVCKMPDGTLKAMPSR